MRDEYVFLLCMAINFTVGLSWLIIAIKTKERISGDFFLGWVVCTLAGPLVTFFCGFILVFICIVGPLSWLSETIADKINRRM